MKRLTIAQILLWNTRCFLKKQLLLVSSSKIKKPLMKSKRYQLNPCMSLRRAFLIIKRRLSIIKVNLFIQLIKISRDISLSTMYKDFKLIKAKFPSPNINIQQIKVFINRISTIKSNLIYNTEILIWIRIRHLIPQWIKAHSTKNPTSDPYLNP